MVRTCLDAASFMQSKSSERRSDWIVRPGSPLRPCRALRSCLVAAPDLLRKGRPVSPSLATELNPRLDREVALEGLHPNKQRVLELCRWGDPEPPSAKGNRFPINMMPFAPTFSFPGSYILLRHLRS